MSEIKVCKFINQADVNKQERLILCTEWSDSGCKLLIFGRRSPLEGELTTAMIEQFASDQSKSKESYIEETRENFTLRDPETKFYMKNDTFQWKKSIWKLGTVQLQPVSSIETISDFLQKLLTHFETFQNSITDIKSSNSKLISHQFNLEKKVDELIKVKQSMEKELYTKFLFVLNNKKRKIRELEGVLKSKEAENQTFDTQTDDSQDLMNDYKKRKPISRHFVKRKYLQSQQDSEESVVDDPVSSSKVEVPIKAAKEETDSTSSTTLETTNEETKGNSGDKLEIAETTKNGAAVEDQENSDEEICLKLTDDSTESPDNEASKHRSFCRGTIIESESEDDLFSQSF